MQGLYIHIPFCHQACYYCNFHFIVSKKYIKSYINALKKEIYQESQNCFINKKKIDTIYFGGGTPSLLSIADLNDIFNTIAKYFDISNTIETTLECNPDDLSHNYINELKQLGINRLSIGIQSFNNKVLKYLNRKHTAIQAAQSIDFALNSGIKNITADLIYGIPYQTNSVWINDINTLINKNIPHLSCYGLTVEPQTPLSLFIEKKKTITPKENRFVEHYNILQNEIIKHNYYQYEISNYCQAGFESKHNSLYWSGKSYLGLGASAHSYNQNYRKINIANTTTYIKNIANNKSYSILEKLSDADKANEYLLTSLRTSKGCDLNFLRSCTKEKIYKQILQNLKSIDASYINQYKNHLTLTLKGKLFSNNVISDLFYIQ